MRSWLILILLNLVISLQSYADNTKPIDIIFDIDWTAFYSVDEAHRDGKTVFVEGKFYRPTDFLTETVEWLLLRHPEVRISFFSGGERSRNEILLDKIRLSDGRSLKDISFRIFSKEHLHIASQDSNLKFAERYKKDVSGLLPDWNPAQSILIDDQVMFAKAPLKAVSSLGTYNFQSSFNPRKAGENFFPPSAEAWALERNKAALWTALLDKAFRTSANGSLDFSQATLEAWSLHSSDPAFASQGRAILRPFSALSCGKVFGF